MEVFARFSLAHEIYYFAILVERQIWFGDTVQISLVLQGSENLKKNKRVSQKTMTF